VDGIDLTKNAEVLFDHWLRDVYGDSGSPNIAAATHTAASPAKMDGERRLYSPVRPRCNKAQIQADEK
jgi:hypothetical protein